MDPREEIYDTVHALDKTPAEKPKETFSKIFSQNTKIGTGTLSRNWADYKGQELVFTPVPDAELNRISKTPSYNFYDNNSVLVPAPSVPAPLTLREEVGDAVHTILKIYAGDSKENYTELFFQKNPSEDKSLSRDWNNYEGQELIHRPASEAEVFPKDTESTTVYYQVSKHPKPRTFHNSMLRNRLLHNSPISGYSGSLNPNAVEFVNERPMRTTYYNLARQSTARPQLLTVPVIDPRFAPPPCPETQASLASRGNDTAS